VKRLVWTLATVAGGAFALFVALTSLISGSAVASGAPCPRNWAWIDTWLPRQSPLGSVAFEIDGAKGRVCYGRPSLRGRTMLGGQIPYGRLWRLGANEPTTLHLGRPARLGSLQLLPGAYSLYAIPEADRWRLVVNRSIRQWGLESEYDAAVAAREVGRVDARVEPAEAPVETFTISATRTASGAVELVFEWDRARVRVPLVGGMAYEALPEAEEGESTINPEIL
jgi:hypothetical protein